MQNVVPCMQSTGRSAELTYELQRNSSALEVWLCYPDTQMVFFSKESTKWQISSKKHQWKPINQTHLLPSKCSTSVFLHLSNPTDRCLHVLLKGYLTKLQRSPWKCIDAFCLPASLYSHLCHSLAMPLSRLFNFFSGLQ